MGDIFLLGGLEDLDSVLQRMNQTLENVPRDFLHEQGFTAAVESLGIDATPFHIAGEPGAYHLVESDGVTIRDVNTLIIQKALAEGDLTFAVKRLMGWTEEETVRVVDPDRHSAYRDWWKKQGGKTDLSRIKSIEVAGRERFVREGGNPPVDAADFRDRLWEKENEYDASYRERSGKKWSRWIKEKKAGRWVKTTIGVGLAVFGASVVFALINRHREDMNGCWLVHLSSGDKCKVASMSACPHRGGVKDMCSHTAFPPTRCVVKTSTNALNAHTCQERLGECVSSGAPCSKWCTKLAPPPGYVLRCVQVGFFGAAEDLLVEEPLDLLGSSTLKTILWIAMGSMAVMLMMWIFGFFRRGGR